MVLLTTLRFGVLTAMLAVAATSNVGAASSLVTTFGRVVSPAQPISSMPFGLLSPDNRCRAESCVTVTAGKNTYVGVTYGCSKGCYVVYWTASCFKWVHNVQQPTSDIKASVPEYNPGTGVTVTISTTRTKGSAPNKFGVIVEGCVYTSPSKQCQDTTIDVTVTKSQLATFQYSAPFEQPFALATV